MPVKMELWQATGQNGAELTLIPSTRLDQEKRLEDWIQSRSEVLGSNLLLIGQQVRTIHGGIVDLLALDENANCVVLELKRDQTPREVVAQTLDYASWVKTLTFAELDNICQRTHQKGLADAFNERFSTSLPEKVNEAHRLIIVASQLDPASERIVQYLQQETSLNINVLFFQYYQIGGTEILARSWLSDPVEITQTDAPGSSKFVPWSGYWYVNAGEDAEHNWDDCRAYGFVAAGGGRQWSKRLDTLKPGDKIFAYLKGRGYVGYGVVTQAAVMAKDFVVAATGEKLFDLPAQGNIKHHPDDAEVTDYLVGVEWKTTFGRDEAKWRPKDFANQNIVCKLGNPNGMVTFLENAFSIQPNEDA